MKQFIIILAVINFLMRIPFSNLPLHHDELTFFDGTMKIYQNNLNPFIEFWGYKPPVFYETAAVLFKILGPSRIWARLIVNLFSSLSLIFTYLLGKRVFSPKIGIFAALLLFFSPLFAGQSFLFQTPTLITFLTLTTVYFYFSKKRWLYLIFGSLLILTHETTVFLIMLLGIFDFCQNRGKNLSRSLSLFFPLIPFFIWTVVNKLTLGWFLWPTHLSLLTGNRVYLQKPWGLVLEVASYHGLFWLIFLAIFLGLLWSFSKEGSFNKSQSTKVIFFVFLFFSYLVIFYKLDFLPRYMLFLYPLVFFSLVWCLEIFLKRKFLACFLVIILCGYFLYIDVDSLFLSSKPVIWAGEMDLSFLRTIMIQKRAANYITQNFPESILVAKWPIYQAFGDPIYGYVNQKIRTLPCETDKDVNQVKNALLNSEGKKIILVTSTTYWASKCFRAFNPKFIGRITLVNSPQADKVELYFLNL